MINFSLEFFLVLVNYWTQSIQGFMASTSLSVITGKNFDKFGGGKMKRKITYWYFHRATSWIVYSSQCMYTKKKKDDEFGGYHIIQPELVVVALTSWLSHHCAWSILRVSMASATSIWTVLATDGDFSSTSRVCQLVLQLLVSSLTIVP